MGLGLKKLGKCTTNLCSTDETRTRSLGKTYVRFLGCQTISTSEKWNCLISSVDGQVERQTSYMDLSIRHQKKDPFVALGTPSVTLNGGLAQNKEYSLEYRLFVENYFHVIHIFVSNKISQMMKKYYYDGPTFKLWRRSCCPAFKLWRESWGPTFKL